MLETKTPTVPTVPGTPVPYQFLPKEIKVILVDFTIIIFFSEKTQLKQTLAGFVGA